LRPPTMSRPTITTISASPTHTPMLRCTTGATSSARPTVLSSRIPRPPACRPASCSTWLPTMLPNTRWFPGRSCNPHPRQGKREELAAGLTPLTTTRRGIGVVPGPSTTGPTSAAYPIPPGRATLGGRLRPRGLGHTSHAPPSAWSSRSASRDRAGAARRQRRRRARIPPNSNTATTTMISTHNHVDMEASLVGAGAGQADTTAAHPGKQLPASRRCPGPGSTAALRAGLQGPCTPRSARRSGLARQPTMPPQEPG
jgi:hypothetical protein